MDFRDKKRMKWKKREKNLVELSSASELDDARGEWLEIGFVRRRGFSDQTTACGKRGTYFGLFWGE
jgi:hypothetical protein